MAELGSQSAAVFVGVEALFTEDAEAVVFVITLNLLNLSVFLAVCLTTHLLISNR